MKLLVIMSNYPFPPRTGSSIVAYNALKFLSKDNQIDLVCLQSKNRESELPVFVKDFDLVEHRKKSGLIKWIIYFFHLLNGVPPSVSVYASKAMKKKVEYKVEKGNYDSLLLFEMSAIQYCPVTSFQKLIVNIEDPQSLKIFRMAELPIWSKIQKVKLFVLAKLMAFYENGMLPKVAKVIVLSKNDKNDMGNNGSLTNLACVTYGVEQRDCSEIIGYQGRDKVIIFSGSMYHPPNVDGALFFLNNIFPLVLEVNPTAKFQIVGAEPDSRIYKAAARFGQRVEITGRVNSVSMYIKRAAVSVCPVRLKIGVQTKILEALSWGTPTVSTSAGNSGIGGLSGTHLWIEDDARMFAKRVCDLLHGIEWEKLSLEGRKLVADSFTWEASTAQLEQHIVSVTSKCR